MLDQRPIMQKSLIGAGAFAFVFVAAMAGTSFMISGGVDLSRDSPHFRHEPVQLMNDVQDTLRDWAVPRSEARTVPASLSERTPDEPWVDPASPEGLDGEVATQPAEAVVAQPAEAAPAFAGVDEEAAPGDDVQTDDNDSKDDASF